MNYDCYLISSYVARRPFLYVDGASGEAVCMMLWLMALRGLLFTGCAVAQITDIASCCYLHKLFQ